MLRGLSPNLISNAITIVRIEVLGPLACLFFRFASLASFWIRHSLAV